VWKVDGGNKILLMDLSPFYSDNMRSWLYYYFPFFSLGLHESNFFLVLGHASGARHLFSFFLIAQASFGGY